MYQRIGQMPSKQHITLSEKQGRSLKQDETSSNLEFRFRALNTGTFLDSQVSLESVRNPVHYSNPNLYL